MQPFADWAATFFSTIQPPIVKAKQLNNWIALIAICIGICYVWFGALKLFPELSPAECLAEQTISSMTFGMISGRLACMMLAAIEVAIGVALILRFQLRWAILAMLGHMICTLTPMFLLPDQFFGNSPWSLTLVGQYVIKNIVFISVAAFIYHWEQMQAQTAKS